MSAPLANSSRPVPEMSAWIGKLWQLYKSVDDPHSTQLVFVMYHTEEICRWALNALSHAPELRPQSGRISRIPANRAA